MVTVRTPEGSLFLGIYQLGLQLLQQAGLRAAGGEEEVFLAPGTQLGFAGPLQQFLELGPEPAEAGLEPRCAEEPVFAEGIQTAGLTFQALPQVAAGGEQVELHLHHPREGLQQLHLNRRHAAESEQAQGLVHRQARQRLAPRPLLQAFDHRRHPQAEGLGHQALGQLGQQQRLPVLVRRQGPAVAIEALARAPGRHHGRPVQGVIVEGVGDGPPQLPQGPIQLGQLSGCAVAPLFQPAAQQQGFRLLHQRR